MQKGPVTPKGFVDMLPEIATKRRTFINKISTVLEKFDFKPLETPIVEFAETLLGKYGEEEKLVYQFEDKGGRKLALRYDLTVPLARFVANNLRFLSPTFSRYQIGQVFRGEKPQKGRSREFTQFDYDIVGSEDIREDARVVAAAVDGIRAIGFSKAKLAINDRNNFKGLKVEDIRLIDKMHKIGRDKMPQNLLNFIEKTKPTENLLKIFKILESEYKLKENIDFYFDPTLARGLDYYTSTVFEMKLNGNPSDLSIGGGGRYDNLIGMFAGRKIPAVGFSFGIDRIVELQ
ncbi:MAG: ATP phosphoribosyltransferase regulatory subunit [Candidatus Woesebacteria bacterium]|nr:ATP phosphoribosyltransferase regulatory subunit [Candidatus Woesebacteria bacterium]